ncbi:MAG: DUF4783 domain-containing protein [Bacteroidia bacterium]|nr:DUF4783 domain-containing protein [Bacteroidia bacterium]
MKAIIKIISVFLLIFVISPQGYAQSEVMSKFSSSIKAGNVQELIKGLADPVELSIEGQEKSLGKSEAAAAIGNFISQHPLQNFEYLHQGSSGTAEYAIARYSSGGQNYRVMVKTKGNVIEKIEFKKE